MQLEIGKVCEQANGQVMVRYGDSVVNCTVCASKEARPDADFLPLSCDYEEKMYAVGKIREDSSREREGRARERSSAQGSWTGLFVLFSRRDTITTS